MIEIEIRMEHSLAGILWRLAGVLALVFANGFFVAAEFSIVTVRKTRIDQLIAEGHRGARAVRRAVTDPDELHRRDAARHHDGQPRPRLDRRAGAGVADSAAVHIRCRSASPKRPRTASPWPSRSRSMTALHIVLGELAPKTIALERAEATALLVVKPTELFMQAFWPFIRLLNGTGRAVVGLLGLRSRGGHAMVHSEEELKMLVTASQEAGVLEEQEEQMLHRVFGFADLTAGQVMVPRTELVAVAGRYVGRALLEQIGRGGYAAFPVYKTDLDNVVGILHVIDVIKAIAAGRQNVDAAALAREALTVPETMAADDLLAAMRRRGVREAMVIDEYGGTAGLVTFESLMERIVGERRDGRRGQDLACSRTDRPTSTASRWSPTSTSSSACTSTRTPTRRSAATCWAGSAAARASAKRLRLKAASCVSWRPTRLRVSRVWLSTPMKPAAPSAGDAGPS